MFILVACLLCMAAGSASGAPPEVGSMVPDFTLATLGDSVETLAQSDGPTVLVFFRGVW